MSKTIESDITETDLLASLAAELNAKRKLPGDVTSQDLAKATGNSREYCRKFLEGKVEAGELTRHEITDRGHSATVYRRKV